MLLPALCAPMCKLHAYFHNSKRSLASARSRARRACFSAFLHRRSASAACRMRAGKCALAVRHAPRVIQRCAVIIDQNSARVSPSSLARVPRRWATPRGVPTKEGARARQESTRQRSSRARVHPDDRAARHCIGGRRAAGRSHAARRSRASRRRARTFPRHGRSSFSSTAPSCRSAAWIARAAEIPIEITPPLACQWRWLDTSALACQLGDGDELTLATRYTLVVHPGIAAEDGATTDGVRRHEFVDASGRASAIAGFATWRSPGTPVIRAVFTQPVSESSVREHLFMRHARRSARRPSTSKPTASCASCRGSSGCPASAYSSISAQPQPASPVDDRPTAVERRDGAPRLARVGRSSELPLDTRVELVVEPGLVPAEGTELGDERRVVVEFDTFPEFAFLGVRCRDVDNEALVVPACRREQRRQPAIRSRGVGLAFSAPVLASEIKAHVEIVPDLAGGRTDYDPVGELARLLAARPARTSAGESTRSGCPSGCEAAEPYRCSRADAAAGPQDEFGRPLRGAARFRVRHEPSAARLHARPSDRRARARRGLRGAALRDESRALRVALSVADAGGRDVRAARTASTCRPSRTFSTACRSAFARCSAASPVRSSAGSTTTPFVPRLAVGRAAVRGSHAVSAAREARPLQLARLGHGPRDGRAGARRRGSRLRRSVGGSLRRRGAARDDGDGRERRRGASRHARARSRSSA